VVLKSVNHEKVPEKKGFVRGSVLVSGFIFISDGKGGSQIVRIVQVSPRRRIVNNTGQFVVSQCREKAECKCI
jgi:hypothetical protein